MSELEIRGLSKSFGSTTVLAGIGMIVADASTTAVVGSSGCGKTTLLRVIAGFETPDAGTVSIGGSMVAGAGRSMPPNRRNVGYVAQDGALFPHLTVAQNVAYGVGGRLHRRSVSRVTELLEMVALDAEYASRRPHELSGGQQQRVALARALARRPEVMLLDEPFSALDTGLRVSTRNAVAAALHESGVTTILVTHDQEEALSFADQVAVMRTGTFTQVGSPEQVYSEPADLFTATFLGDCVLLPADLRDGVADCALGRIPVQRNGTTRSATIMLRPGQIIASDVDLDTAHTHGTVVGREFRGSQILLTVALPDGKQSIEVRHANVGAPELASKVRIDVIGTAIAFD